MALSGAYHGYLHQDAVTAYLLAIRKADLGIRMSLSRTVRPIYLQSPSTAGDGTIVLPPITGDRGQFAGWVVLAQRETQLQIGEGYEHPVTAKRVLHAGVVFSEWKDDGGLPFAYPYRKMWQPLAWKKIGVPHSFGGPIAALGEKRRILANRIFCASSSDFGYQQS
jgi:hypothetical protein